MLLQKLKHSARLTPYEILSVLNESCCNTANPSSNVVLSYNFKALNISLRTVLTKFISEHQTLKSRNRHALWFMRGLMDECTHLKNFSVPFNTSLIIALCAKHDGYVPREGCSKLEDIWPGATVRYLEGGHVSSYIKYLELFRYKKASFIIF